MWKPIGLRPRQGVLWPEPIVGVLDVASMVALVACSAMRATQIGHSATRRAPLAFTRASLAAGRRSRVGVASGWGGVRNGDAVPSSSRTNARSIGASGTGASAWRLALLSMRFVAPRRSAVRGMAQHVKTHVRASGRRPSVCRSRTANGASGGTASALPRAGCSGTKPGASAVGGAYGMALVRRIRAPHPARTAGPRNVAASSVVGVA
mmetsp:Transcript_47699/g.137338  ORF Transcript_47699/g.137338 Transcript_47699/m.137338 type:complete len:208 (-) Transcript_47699:1175-1798(-)